jgi:hypothetical protein
MVKALKVIAWGGGRNIQTHARGQKGDFLN